MKRSGMRWLWAALAAVLLLGAGQAWAGGTHGGRAMPVDPSAPSDFMRYRVTAAFLPLLAAGIVVAWAAARVGRRNRKGPPAPLGFDLLATPRLGRILRSPLWPWAWQAPATVGFAAVVGAGLAGWELASTITWAIWWPAMALLVLAGSRAWCLACPPGALAEWAGASGRPRRAFPASLRTLWLPAILLVGLAWLYDTWDVAGSGWRTAVLLLAFTLAAVALSLRYTGRSFCRYVCPVGALAGVLGLLGSLAIVARSRRVCAEHRPKPCLARDGGRPGCPMLEVPFAMDRPLHCHLCLECVRSCGPDNLALVARPPGWCLRQGREARWDEVGFGLVLSGVALVQMFTMVGWVRAQAGNAFVLALAYAALGVGVPLAAIGALRGGMRRLGAGATLAVVVPVAWALFAVHNLDHLVPRWLARWPGTVLWAQAVLLLIGSAAALVFLAGRVREAGAAPDGRLSLGLSLPLGLGLLVGAAYYALSYPPMAAAGADGAPGPPIAYISDRSGMPEVYLLDERGGPARRLVLQPLRALEVAWAPDGRRLAIVAERDGGSDLYVVGADGSGLARLTHSPAPAWGPLWSPDAAQIAYVAGVGMEAEVSVVPAAGGAPRRLTVNARWDYPRSWSPDGRTLLLETAGRDERVRIAALEVVTGELRYLTDGKANDGDPAYSPDGRRIVFSSDRDGNREIYVMRADGTGVRRLTAHPAWDGHPYWSADGTRILFESDRGPANTFEVMMMFADGGRVTNLTRNGVDDKHPSWSPDGRRVLYESHRDGQVDLFLVELDGSNERNLTRHPASDMHASW